MPYILNKDKERLNECKIDINTAGELNYKITILVLSYLNKHGKSYKVINDIIGALECSKLEFYRRIVAPYEEVKIKENGDVYPRL